MKRREFIAVLGGVAAWPVVARAQQASMPVIGILHQGANRDFASAFQQGLRQSGYVEGQNITTDFRWAEGRYDTLPALATELVRRRVNVIAAAFLPAALAAQSATGTIPIVFLSGSDPVETGLVSSLNRPSGNVTGIMIAKSLAILTP